MQLAAFALPLIALALIAAVWFSVRKERQRGAADHTVPESTAYRIDAGRRPDEDRGPPYREPERPVSRH